MKILKVGIDIHGVIDAFPEKFKLLSLALINDGAEVHIITGIKRSRSIDLMLDKAGIKFTHFFSIVDYLEATDQSVEWKNELPYADKETWNNAKRNYCQRMNIDLMIDDSSVYRDTFNDIDTTYLHVTN